MKKIGISLLCLFVLSLGACVSAKKYERDTREGEYVEITYQQMQEKIENGDMFIALISQTSCTHCQEYKKDILKPYLKDHHLEIYELNITNEENPKETFTDIQNYMKDIADEEHQFLGTPYTFVAKDKKVALGISGSIEMEHLDEIVMKYQLDMK